MSMPQASNSNVVAIEAAQLARTQLKTKNLTIDPANFTETSLQIGLQLQSTLDIGEILAIFFRISQHLIRYEALHFIHNTREVNIRLGQAKTLYAVNYHLTFQDEYLGDLFLQRSNTIHEHELAHFESLITSLIFPLRNALKYHAALQSTLQDPLTGVGNRASMAQTLQRDMNAAKRTGQALSILMLDIDYFKSINDTYGHTCGDQVLIEVANTLKLLLRNTDAIFRFGGEEFLITMPNTDTSKACRVGERLREAMEDLTVEFNGKPVVLSASLGCATLRSAESQDDFIQRADYALYSAKRNGRNCLRCAE